MPPRERGGNKGSLVRGRYCGTTQTLRAPPFASACAVPNDVGADTHEQRSPAPLRVWQEPAAFAVCDDDMLDELSLGLAALGGVSVVDGAGAVALASGMAGVVADGAALGVEAVGGVVGAGVVCARLKGAAHRNNTAAAAKAWAVFMKAPPRAARAAATPAHALERRMPLGSFPNLQQG